METTPSKRKLCLKRRRRLDFSPPAHKFNTVNADPDAGLLQRHFAESLSKASTTLMTSDAVFNLTAEQIEILWSKFSDHIHRDLHGVSDLANELQCEVLVFPEAKPTEYTRKHTGVKNRRGPYRKLGFSHSGGYAQTTYTKADHKSLKTKALFPSTRTFQCTHLALLRNGKRPPKKNRQLYTASHICGFAGCLRHLEWELIDANFARRMCHVFGAYAECPHQLNGMPPCIHRAPPLVAPPTFTGGPTIS